MPGVQSRDVEITRLAAGELRERIAAGALSAAEVVEAHIRRIEAVNPRLNALVVPLFDQARSQAKAADAGRERGEPLGPLHGVPFTVKENIDGTNHTLQFDRHPWWLPGGWRNKVCGPARPGCTG